MNNLEHFPQNEPSNPPVDLDAIMREVNADVAAGKIVQEPRAQNESHDFSSETDIIRIQAREADKNRAEEILNDIQKDTLN
jgi:capsular polysaccharide biosynthesis protein